MEMLYYDRARASYQDTLKLLEADIQHANALAAAIPSAKGGTHLQMKLVYDHTAPLFLFLLQWLDRSCTYLLPRYLNLLHIQIYKVYKDGRPNLSTHGRKATIHDFYAVILPSLQRLHDDSIELNTTRDTKSDMVTFGKKKVDKYNTSLNVIDFERDAECGICLEPCSKVVLPSCCHEMCINCYRDWNTRSESCPFCRSTLKRVKSEDLWVLTCNSDFVDAETASKQDLLHFYIYINSLPMDCSDVLFFLYYEYLI